jgi:Uma2 family endonuclease
MNGDHERILDEYLATEERSPVRREFLGGEVFAMGGARPAHNVVTSRLTAEMDAALRGRPCLVFSADQRVHLEATEDDCYPDPVVTCEPPRFVPPAPDSLVNPTAIFEVVSPTTESWDRGGKFTLYQSIPSLALYVLVDPARRRVEWYTRVEGSDAWLYRSAAGDTPARLDPLGVTLVPDTLFAALDLLPPDEGPISQGRG